MKTIIEIPELATSVHAFLIVCELFCPDKCTYKNY